MRCVYRTESVNQGQDANFPFKFLATEKCDTCQVLQAQNVKDATCYNSELSEKTCAISPQQEKTPTK